MDGYDVGILLEQINQLCSPDCRLIRKSVDGDVDYLQVTTLSVEEEGFRKRSTWSTTTKGDSSALIGTVNETISFYPFRSVDTDKLIGGQAIEGFGIKCSDRVGPDKCNVGSFREMLPDGAVSEYDEATFGFVVSDGTRTEQELFEATMLLVKYAAIKSDISLEKLQRDICSNLEYAEFFLDQTASWCRQSGYAQ